jgi:hypothetical protein
MSLRRTPLTRKTPLRASGSVTTRKAALNRRAVQAARRPRPDTGPSQEVRELVIARSYGRCEHCGRKLRSAGQWIDEHSFHHRRPRGMGGTNRPETNGAANLLLLCGSGTTGCHGLIEAGRAMAHESGQLLWQTQDPAEVPVWILRRGLGLVSRLAPALLGDDGSLEWVNP